MSINNNNNENERTYGPFHGFWVPIIGIIAIGSVLAEVAESNTDRAVIATYIEVPPANPATK
ncbi:MAG: hypothetical protein JWO47_485 [Candidatus Saccharibacteria bacterium]|nr:hypothetical protein [Candidatus Saccharibacteria bacterium]